MKLVAYSRKRAEQAGTSWQRAGNDISYFANGIRMSAKFPRPLYTLRFSYRFEYDQDTVFFAYSYPYTYTQLTEFLNKLEADSTTNE